MNEINGDMLAMSTHGRTGVAHLIKGSIAETLVYGTDHPVWILKIRTK
jgi:nucleotide-binding universal stress UspA family protein